MGVPQDADSASHEHHRVVEGRVPIRLSLTMQNSMISICMIEIYTDRCPLQLVF